jgi:hypothetical protein
MSYRDLDTHAVAITIERLCRRVEHRFPDSGLAKVCRELDQIGDHTKERARWIAKPILGLRVAAGFLILVIVGGLAFTIVSLRAPSEEWSLGQFIQVLEAGINDVVLVGAGAFFLVTMETRIKRRRALAALHELRVIAHVIDMHQLTKDPEWLLGRGKETGLVPARTMSRFELSRYLDYCSEALSLTAKIAAIYAQAFDDEVSLRAVQEIEDLTNGLSRKIWQKLMILHAVSEPGDAASRPPDPRLASRE